MLPGRSCSLLPSHTSCGRAAKWDHNTVESWLNLKTEPGKKSPNKKAVEMVCLKEKVAWNDWLWMWIWGIFLLLLSFY